MSSTLRKIAESHSVNQMDMSGLLHFCIEAYSFLVVESDGGGGVGGLWGLGGHCVLFGMLFVPQLDSGMVSTWKTAGEQISQVVDEIEL